MQGFDWTGLEHAAVAILGGLTALLVAVHRARTRRCRDCPHKHRR